MFMLLSINRRVFATICCCKYNVVIWPQPLYWPRRAVQQAPMKAELFSHYEGSLGAHMVVPLFVDGYVLYIVQSAFVGGVSISDKTSYCNISWSLEVARLIFRTIALIWNLTGASAAPLPMCLSNFRAIGQSKHNSRGFKTSRDLTIRRLIGYWNGALAPKLEC